MAPLSRFKRYTVPLSSCHDPITVGAGSEAALYVVSMNANAVLQVTSADVAIDSSEQTHATDMCSM